MNVMGYSLFLVAVEARPRVTSISVHLHIENTTLRAERQREGIAKAKRAGVHFGRTKALTREQADELRALRAEGVTMTTLMQRYGIGKTAVYRYLVHTPVLTRE